MHLDINWRIRRVLYRIIDALEGDFPTPDPEMLALANEQKEHIFTVRVFWGEEDNCWFAEVPELRGLLTDGETLPEVLEPLGDLMPVYVALGMAARWYPPPKQKVEQEETL